MSPIRMISGINHNAYVMWDPDATIRFYRDIMGFPIVHAITAKGWGQDDHADFAHIFFDIGGSNCIAFFYYFDVEPRDSRSKDYVGNGRHMAFHCDTEEQLLAWRGHLKKSAVNVSPPIRHELIESIYFTDPNGYPLEITRPMRSMNKLDAADAELTVAALLASVATGAGSAEDMWRRKGELVKASLAGRG
jgi:catechol 2,3-dioxygenase-like lactoylglutathione lyase family enzyme